MAQVTGLFIMPFGKYKGRVLKEAPFAYVDWLMRELCAENNTLTGEFKTFCELKDRALVRLLIDHLASRADADAYHRSEHDWHDDGGLAQFERSDAKRTTRLAMERRVTPYRREIPAE